MFTHLPLLIETQNILNEPEPEQSSKWWYGKGVEDAKYFLTRKPLSDDEIFNLWTVRGVNNIYDLVRRVEKTQHRG